MISADLGRSEYRLYSELLGIAVSETLNPLQRAAALPSWFSRELVATAPARDRLRAWARAGGPVHDAATIARLLSFVGDREIREVVLRALVERIPPPVVHAVLGSCWILGVGWSANGWCADAPPTCDVYGPLTLVMVSGARRNAEETATTFAHEIGHFWTLAPPDVELEAERMSERIERDRDLDQIAVALGRFSRLIAPELRHERLACECARAWGFTGHAAVAECAVVATAMARERDAAAVSAPAGEP